ncbi:hypothetical protein LTR39_003757, partial [Cryomyces antarcticus]
MSSSLLRPQRRSRRQDRSPFSSPFTSFPGAAGRDDNPRRIGAVHEEDEAAESYNEGDGAEEEGDGHENDEDEDEDDDATPLLPIFAAAHL